MRMLTLLRQLSRMDPSKLEGHNMYAFLYDPKSHKGRHVCLTMKTDLKGRPYFVADLKAQAAHDREMARKRAKYAKYN